MARVLVVSTDEHLGAPAVRGLTEAVEGRAVTSARWAPPLIWPREAAERAEALDLLPPGTDLMNVDGEKFGVSTQ